MRGEPTMKPLSTEDPGQREHARGAERDAYGCGVARSGLVNDEIREQRHVFSGQAEASIVSR
jgi:hypothetical protein